MLKLTALLSIIPAVSVMVMETSFVVDAFSPTIDTRIAAVRTESRRRQRQRQQQPFVFSSSRSSTSASLFRFRNSDTAVLDKDVDKEKVEIPVNGDEAATRDFDDEATSTALEATTTTTADDDETNEEEMTESQKLMKQVKESGTAGIVSYALWELAFWMISVPVCVVGFREVTGHWPDFSAQEDMQKIGAEAFAFVNFARFAVPLRIGLALSTTPWIDKNIVKKFFNKEEGDDDEGSKDD